MTKTILISVALGLALAACDRDDRAADNAAMAGNADLDVNATADANASATAPVSANDFANMVAAGDKYEIEAGNLAAGKASSAEVKSFAQMLVTAHTKSTADLKTSASQASPPVTPNDTLDAEKQGMLSQLQGASGADFDRMFIDQQITAHEKALALLQNYAAGGDNQALKEFATKAVPIVQGHLDQARSLKK